MIISKSPKGKTMQGNRNDFISKVVHQNQLYPVLIR